MSEEEIIERFKMLINNFEDDKNYYLYKISQEVLDLYQKEKEKNEKLIEGQVETIEKIIQPELFKKYISKDKIKELLEDVDKTPFINKHVKGQYLYDNLKMLLQEGGNK